MQANPPLLNLTVDRLMVARSSKVSFDQWSIPFSKPSAKITSPILSKEGIAPSLTASSAMSSNPYVIALGLTS
ncbi:hypothetical protein ES708_26231 [subsurface metagenome]